MMTEDFIKERKYLKGVSDKTLAWYRDSFRAFKGALDTQDEVKQRIVELRQRGVKPVSVNTWLRCIKAYFLWQGKEWKIGNLQEERKIIASFSPQQITRIIDWKPVKSSDLRLHTLVLTALDSGLRVNELLSLRRADVDLENLLFRVVGKGNKHRLVPMSVKLRKCLFRYLAKHNFDRAFPTHDGGKLGSRNLLRDFKIFCRRLDITGVRCSFHTLRHSFAVNYLRAGGNIEYLRRILGHSSILTTQKYLRSLGIEDLQKVHDGLSLLSR